MTTREHMDNLAQRYAQALVYYHQNPERDGQYLLDIHEMLNEVCKEMAAELLDNVETL